MTTQVPRIVEKGWGHEIIYINRPSYGGKILHFTAGGKTSLHFHARKDETFYALSGQYILRMINPRDATKYDIVLTTGQTVEVPHLRIHQIIAITDGDLLEASTGDDEYDKYRVEEGSTQACARLPVVISVEGAVGSA